MWELPYMIVLVFRIMLSSLFDVTPLLSIFRWKYSVNDHVQVYLTYYQVSVVTQWYTSRVGVLYDVGGDTPGSDISDDTGDKWLQIVSLWLMSSADKTETSPAAVILVGGRHQVSMFTPGACVLPYNTNINKRVTVARLNKQTEI